MRKNVQSEQDISLEPEFISSENGLDTEGDNLYSPTMYFKKFIDDSMMTLLVEQSNLYSIQKDPKFPLKLSKDELEIWLGLTFIFSLSKISNSRLHWSQDFSNDKYIHLMARRRWEDIKSSLHLVDNTKIDPADKISKIRPLVEHLRAKFRELIMNGGLCIDESIVPNKARPAIKVYVPKKANNWGFKFYVLADKFGLVYDFFISCERVEPVLKEGIPHPEANANIGLQLSQLIPEDRDFKMYFDQCPIMSNSYNKAMGGVDLHDQLISLYGFPFKSKKLYHRMLFHLIDMALINAWLLYGRDADKLNILPKKQLSLSEFKVKIAKSLLYMGKSADGKKREKPSFEKEIEAKRRRLNRGLPLPEKDYRYDHIDHWPVRSKERHLCKMPECKAKINTYCTKCKVFLCINYDKNCFQNFHTE